MSTATRHLAKTMAPARRLETLIRKTPPLLAVRLSLHLVARLAQEVLRLRWRRLVESAGSRYAGTVEWLEDAEAAILDRLERR